MIIATIYKFWGVQLEATWLIGGINIPEINLQAFSTELVRYTHEVKGVKETVETSS